MPHKKKRKIKTPGLIYRRPDSPYLWIAFSRNGRKYRKSTGTSDEKVAADILKVELGNSVTKPVDPAAINKVTVGDLAAAFLQDYAVSGKSSLADAEARWRLHLEPEFGNCLASQVGTAAINAYRQKRREQGAALATLNRELAFLKASFRFGIESEPPTVLRCPKIKLPKEKNARQGFFEDGAQHKLYEYCGELWFRGAVEIARVFGWRISEVKGLRVKQADFTDRTLTLYQGETKNGEGRVVTMPRDLCLLLRECARGKGPDDYLLTRKNGKRIRDFRTTWKKACEHAGCPGRLFHDWRRTMAKSLIDSGASEGVIMEIGGWKTRDVFERYSIKTRAAKAKAVQNREDIERDAEQQKLAALIHSENVQGPQNDPAGHVGFTLEIESPRPRIN